MFEKVVDTPHSWINKTKYCDMFSLYSFWLCQMENANVSLSYIKNFRGLENSWFHRFLWYRCFHNAFLEEQIRFKMGSMIHEKCGTPFRVISYKGMVFRQFSKYELVGPPTCFQENLLLHVTC